MYSSIRNEEYDHDNEEKDELETVITGLDGNTQQIFSLLISPLNEDGKFHTTTKLKQDISKL
jgi:hypothetical protein